MDYIIKNFDKIAIAIIIACFTGWIAWRSWNKTRRITASDRYHSDILHTLKGIYPDTINWNENISVMLKNSIPEIELAVIKFKRFITRKTNIETVLQNYKDCCHETKYSNVQAYIMYGKEKGDTDPREIFKNRVDALLEFAKNP